MRWTKTRRQSGPLKVLKEDQLSFPYTESRNAPKTIIGRHKCLHWYQRYMYLYKKFWRKITWFGICPRCKIVLHRSTQRTFRLDRPPDSWFKLQEVENSNSKNYIWMISEILYKIGSSEKKLSSFFKRTLACFLFQFKFISSSKLGCNFMFILIFLPGVRVWSCRWAWFGVMPIGARDARAPAAPPRWRTHLGHCSNTAPSPTLKQKKNN